jgi:hypothetical protein
MTAPSVSEFDSAINEAYSHYRIGFNIIIVPLEEAKETGIDTSTAPIGSVCVITKNETSFVMPEDLP